jgi:hypothetical protein
MARAAAHLALLALSLLPLAATASFPGFVFGLSENGTTNTAQFVAADLETFEVLVVSQLPRYEAIGSAAIVDAASGIYWGCAIKFGITPGVNDSLVIFGVDTSDGSVAYEVPTNTFVPGQWLVADLIYPRSATTAAATSSSSAAAAPAASPLFIVATEPKLMVQYFIEFDPSTGASTVTGQLNMTGGDAAYDPAGKQFFELQLPGDDEGSGDLVVVDLSGSTPTVARTIPLASHFSLPVWDDKTGSLLGLLLDQPTPGDYGRNFTLLHPQSGGFNVTSRGTLGAFYALYDGPKAFDPVGRRAFYAIATSPLGEMDLVTVNVDADPVVVEEAPGLCGFVGYCPEGMAYGLAGPTTWIRKEDGRKTRK